MKRMLRAAVETAGVLSLIGMVLLAILMTRNNYSQYRIGGRE
jgi:hypothetical protein